MKFGLRRARLMTTIRWLLKRRGVRIEEAFRHEGRKSLRELRLREADFRLEELELVESIIEKLDVQILNTVPMDQNAKLLDTLPDVGPYTALSLSSTIGDVNRFQDSKHLAAYLGLVPSMHQSGDVSLMGHRTGTGDRFLRRDMLECARAAARRDPHLKEFYLRLKRERGEEGDHRGGKEAGAYAWWMLKENKTYGELSPWKVH